MIFAVRILLIVLLLTGIARAGGPKPPCTGCTLDVPAKVDAPLPLIVALHGDREHAPAMAARWRAAAKARGWALLSLECPATDGCKTSWWQWNGDPAWVIAQVAAVQKTLAIDPARIYLAGWSGGATYLGMRALAWPDVFAAVVIHGGGQPPGTDACPPRALPAYFLVGDANPLHALAVDLRAWFDGCKQEVAWDLVKRGDHDNEARALTKAKATAILDWLGARPRS
jgi:poly(3-hydroxybutyrate) depolymerase